MTLTTTLALLRKKHACERGLTTLLAALPPGYSETEPINMLTILKSNGIQDVEWVLRNAATVENCLPAWAEYERVTDLAWAEYERVRCQALAEYERRCQALAEYQRVRCQALAEYQRVTGQAWAEILSAGYEVAV